MFNNKEQSFIEFKIKSAEGTKLDFSAGGLGAEQYSLLIDKIFTTAFPQNASIESNRAPEVIPATTPQPPVRLTSYDTDKVKPFVPVTKAKEPQVSRIRKTKFVEHDDREQVYSTADNELASTALFTPEELDLLNKNIGHVNLSEKAQESTEKLFEKKEVVSEADREPDFFKTGIKYKGVDMDKPMYKASYVCPNCNHSGRHYIPDFAKVISCHNCQSKLRVEPATENGFGVGDVYRDKHGNFFVANTLVIDKQPKYEKSI